MQKDDVGSTCTVGKRTKIKLLRTFYNTSFVGENSTELVEMRKKGKNSLNVGQDVFFINNIFLDTALITIIRDYALQKSQTKYKPIYTAN